MTVNILLVYLEITFLWLALSINKQHFSNMGSLGAALGGKTSTMHGNLLPLVCESELEINYKELRSVLNK